MCRSAPRRVILRASIRHPFAIHQTARHRPTCFGGGQKWAVCRAAAMVDKWKLALAGILQHSRGYGRAETGYTRIRTKSIIILARGSQAEPMSSRRVIAVDNHRVVQRMKDR